MYARMLASQGVELHQTDRGGDVTYHGPGQLVCYPIVDLNAAGLRIHEYIRALVLLGKLRDLPTNQVGHGILETDAHGPPQAGNLKCLGTPFLFSW